LNCLRKIANLGVIATWRLLLSVFGSLKTQMPLRLYNTRLTEIETGNIRIYITPPETKHFSQPQAGIKAV
jgi:hypothetical protein